MRRYSEPDKVGSGLGHGIEAWATPYWVVDGGFAAMTMQLAAINEGLGVLFFGMFDFAPELAEVLGVPSTRVPIGTIALGWPDEADQELGRSTSIDRRPLEGDIASVVHRGHW